MPKFSKFMNIQRNNLLTIFILASAMLFSSCSTLLYTSIDVLRPAKISFPLDVDNITILNNALPQPENHGHTNKFLNATVQQATVNTDSLAIFALASFAESMAEKEFFNIISLRHESIKKGQDFQSVNYPLRETINQLSEHENDGVIALNRFVVEDQLGELYDPENGLYYAYLEAIYDYVWSVHFPSKNKIQSFNVKDTVYWEAEAYARQRAMNGLPERKDALIDGALISGSRIVDKFIPYWEEVDRYIFNFSNKKHKQGLDAVYIKDWDTAIHAWEDLLNTTKSQTKKIKTAHNISVVYEIKGDIQKAFEYSEKAMILFNDVVVFDYRSMLMLLEQYENIKQRKIELEIINEQLGTE